MDLDTHALGHHSLQLPTALLLAAALPQRAVRLALNAIHSSLDAWKVRAASLRQQSLVQAGSLPQAVQPSASTPAPMQAAVSEGKAAATALTNVALTQLHLPALPLGLLADVPGLRPAAAAKLRQQQDDALAALGACLERLQEAVAGLAAAADSLCQLGEKDAAAPVLGEAPVFASLPLRLVAGMLAEVHTMHQTELGIKAAVLRGCQQVVGEWGANLGTCAGGGWLLDDCMHAYTQHWPTASAVTHGRHLQIHLLVLCPAGDLRAADQPDGEAGSSSVPGSAGGGGGSHGTGTGRAAAQREEALRRTMQVYLTAWMLSPEVDEGRLEGHLAELEADMRGF